MNSVHFSSKSMCWCTPQVFFDTLNKEFNFVLDAAATSLTAKCHKYFTPETDGLAQSWDCGGAVFCNPPYGREISRWVKKAYEEAKNVNTPLFCSFLQERIQHISTIISTEKQRYALFGDGLNSAMRTELRVTAHRSRQW